MVAFLKFCLFAIYEMRYLMIVWRAGRQSDFQTFEGRRQSMGQLYTRFYGSFAFGLILYQTGGPLSRLFHILIHLYWVPQIVLNFVTNARRPMARSYYCTVTFTRMFLPLCA